MFNSLSVYWQVCIEQAWEGYCLGSLPIGAVIVNQNGEIIGKGRNRIRDKTLEASAKGISAHRLAHAEINALLAADFQSHDPGKCTLYTLAEPCPLCVGAILMANLVHCCYASRDHWAGSTELFEASAYMRSKKVKVEGPYQGLLENATVAWQLEYALRGDENRAEPLLKANEANLPKAVAGARRLYREGILQKIKQEGKPALEMFDQLCTIIEKEA